MRASGDVVEPGEVVSYDLARSFPGYASLSPAALSQMVWRIGSKLTKCEVLFLAAALSDETVPQLWGKLYTSAHG